MKLGKQQILEILVIIQFENCDHPVQFKKIVKVKTYKTIIYKLFWMHIKRSLSWREHKTQLFENKFLTKIFGPKKGDVHTLGHHNEKLHDLCTS
jgi:hypothetical protein